MTTQHYHRAGSDFESLSEATLLLAGVRRKPVVSTVVRNCQSFDLIAVPVVDQHKTPWIVGCVLPAGSVVVRQAAQRMIKSGAVWLTRHAELPQQTENTLRRDLDLAQSEQHAAQIVVDTLSAPLTGWRFSYVALRGHASMALLAVNGCAVPPDQNPWQRSLVRVAREFRQQQHRTGGVLSCCAGDQYPTLNHREITRHIEQQRCRRIVCFGLTPNAGERCAVLIAELDAQSSDTEFDLGQTVASLRDIAPTLAWHNGRAQSVTSLFGRRLATAKPIQALNRVKLKATALCAALCVLVFASVYTVPRVVTAPAELVGHSVRVISAPRHGVIESIEVKAGDTVEAGAVLATLNTDELQGQRAKWRAQIAKVDSEYHSALAAGDRNQTSLHRAQRSELEAELAFTDAEIARSVIVSDRKALVSMSELRDRLGTTVSLGEPLLETTAMAGFSVDVQVSDKDVGLISSGAIGELALAAKPDEAVRITVDRIVPKAAVINQQNVFVVNAQVDALPQDVMPGMTGFARIESGTTTLLSAWTRRSRDIVWMLAWRLGLV